MGHSQGFLMSRLFPLLHGEGGGGCLKNAPPVRGLDMKKAGLITKTEW